MAERELLFWFQGVLCFLLFAANIHSTVIVPYYVLRVWEPTVSLKNKFYGSTIKLKEKFGKRHPIDVLSEHLSLFFGALKLKLKTQVFASKRRKFHVLCHTTSLRSLILQVLLSLFSD